ncbi:hypothetical protein D3C71_1257320 [compost metagenome]
MQISPAGWLNGWSQLNRLFEILPFHPQSRHEIEESGPGQELADPLHPMLLHKAHQICGHAYLDAVKLRLLHELVKGM